MLLAFPDSDLHSGCCQAALLTLETRIGLVIPVCAVALSGVRVESVNRLRFTPDGYVAVVDLKKMTVTGHIDAGGGPDGLASAVRR